MKTIVLIILYIVLQSCNCGCNSQKEQVDNLYTTVEEFNELSAGDTIHFRAPNHENTIVIFQGMDSDSIYYHYDTGIYQGEGKMPYYIFTNK